MCTSGLEDRQKVALKHLNLEFGLPESTITDPCDKLHPTIPTRHVRMCEKPDGHFSKLAKDKQAGLIAALHVMQHAHSSQLNKNYQIDPNAPRGSSILHFGDNEFRGLSSFKTL